MLEKKNFEDIGDKGEVWFGENAMNRMVRWLEKNVDADSQIIDLGCGNGLMCLELHEAGFKNVCGVDYSDHAIELAKKLAQDSGILDSDQVQFSVSNSEEHFLYNKILKDYFERQISKDLIIEEKHKSYPGYLIDLIDLIES